MTRVRPSWGLLLGLVLSSVAGCTVVDEFGPRAVQYNREAEQSQDQGVLLNIVRAMKRRPLEFSGVQSVSGTASASGSGTLGIPYGIHSHSGSLSMTDTVSGGPTFTVAVLDTQEFFQGILNPIPLQTLDFYVQQRYPAALLFNIFIGRIIISQTPEQAGAGGDAAAAPLPAAPGTKPAAGSKVPVPVVLDLPNYVGWDPDVLRFQLVIDYLLNLGLTTESRHSAKTYGPLLTPAEAVQIDANGRALASGLDLKEIALCKLAAKDRLTVIARLATTSKKPADVEQGIVDYCKRNETPPTVSPHDAGKVEKAKKPEKPEASLREITGREDFPQVLYRLQKADSSYRLCFRAPNRPDGEHLEAGKATDAGGTAPTGGGATAAPSTSPDVALTASNAFAGFADDRIGKILQNLADAKGACNANSGASEETQPGDTDRPAGFSGITLGPELGWYLNVLDEPAATDLANRRVNFALRLAPDSPSPPPFPPDKRFKFGGIDFTRPINIEFVPRSTEGIIYYLGELVRRELDAHNRRKVLVPWSPTNYPVPLVPCMNLALPLKDAEQKTLQDTISAETDVGAQHLSAPPLAQIGEFRRYACDAIFSLVRSEPSADAPTKAPMVSVEYDGARYSLGPPDDQTDRSLQVLDLVTQLLALNKSAKSLPATSVFTLVSPP